MPQSRTDTDTDTDTDITERPWFKKKRFAVPLSFVALVFVACGTGGVASDDDSGDSDNAGDKSSSTSKKRPDVKTEAIAIVAEFKENELSADAKYKGKVIQVTGKVSKIDTEMFDDKDYVLKLKGDEFDLLSVDCFDIPNDKLSSLATGQTVTMVGDFKDGGDLGVELNHCRLK